MNSWLEHLTWTEALLASTALCLLLTATGLVSGFAAERYGWSRSRKVFDLPPRPGQVRHEALGNLAFHGVFVPILAAVLVLGGLRFAEGWVAQILGFAAPWWGFQVYYYFLHRAMHLKAVYRIHRWHHLSMVTGPMTGFSMHPLEALGWTLGMLLPPIALSALDLLGLWGYGFFFFFHWISNIAGHANADFAPALSSRLTTLLFNNPVSYHCLHHARFLGNYGFAAATMDRAAGTEFPDWLEVHHRVFAGKPLQSFHDKG